MWLQQTLKLPDVKVIQQRMDELSSNPSLDRWFSTIRSILTCNWSIILVVSSVDFCPMLKDWLQSFHTVGPSNDPNECTLHLLLSVMWIKQYIHPNNDPCHVFPCLMLAGDRCPISVLDDLTRVPLSDCFSLLIKVSESVRLHSLSIHPSSAVKPGSACRFWMTRVVERSGLAAFCTWWWWMPCPSHLIF